MRHELIHYIWQRTPIPQPSLHDLFNFNTGITLLPQVIFHYRFLLNCRHWIRVDLPTCDSHGGPLVQASSTLRGGSGTLWKRCGQYHHRSSLSSSHKWIHLEWRSRCPCGILCPMSRKYSPPLFLGSQVFPCMVTTTDFYFYVYSLCWIEHNWIVLLSYRPTVHEISNTCMRR